MQRVFVVGSELHESHVRALTEFRNTFDGWKKSKRQQSMLMEMNELKRMLT